jgi:hypothetical protein
MFLDVDDCGLVDGFVLVDGFGPVVGFAIGDGFGLMVLDGFSLVDDFV